MKALRWTACLAAFISVGLVVTCLMIGSLQAHAYLQRAARCRISTKHRRGRVLILQTADSVRYRHLVNATRAINERYARRHGYAYRVHRGAIVHEDIHAHLNKVMLLTRYATSGLHDIILYLDADAFVRDESRSVPPLVGGYGLRFCQGKTRHGWDANAGVILVNATDPTAMSVLCSWRRAALHAFFACYAALRGRFWFSDQAILHAVLFFTNTGRSIKVDRWPEECVFNYNGSFVQHNLRSCFHGLSDREETKRAPCAP